MSLTQGLMVWSLRALVLWGAIELGFALYEESGRQRESWSVVRTHAAVMERLEARTRTADRNLIPVQAGLERERQGAHRLDLGDYVTAEEAIASALIDDLNELGATNAEAEVSVTALADDLNKASVDLAWNEPVASVPGVLAGLAGRRRYLSVALVHFARANEGEVKAEAKLEFSFRTEGRAGR